MKKNQILTTTTYAQLVADIRRIITEGRMRAAKAAHHQLVLTYWEVGRRVCDEGLTQRGGYGSSILEDLADELEIDASTLLRCIHFFQVYQDFPNEKVLTWSHYKILLPLNNPQERVWYEKLIDREGLTAARLALVVKQERFEEFQRQKGKAVKTKKLIRPSEATYVYAADVDRVVDGDTIILRIDLGFAVLKEQRIRLAGIDTPSLDEPKGQEAFSFVREQMAKAPFVMVKTNKIDIYGRYVGHIFYLSQKANKHKIFAQGRYLNQELLDKGLARKI